MGFFSNKRIDRILMLGIRTGANIKRAEIIGYLNERKADLKSCGKSDTCNDIANFVDGVIEDLYAEARKEYEQMVDNNGKL